MAFRTTSETHLFIERLIEAVKKRPSLYDPSHEDFRDYKEKAAAWTSVTLELGYENGDEPAIKQKWKNLRDSYMKYRRSQTHPTDPRIKNYKQWPWASHMIFTDVCGYEPRTSNNFEDENNQDSNVNYGLASPEFEEQQETEPEAEEVDEDVKPVNIDIRRAKQEKKKRNNERKEEAILEAVEETLPVMKKPKRIDSVDLLFQSYAKTIKTFTPKRRALMKMQISNMFAQAEIEEIEEREQGYSGNGDPLLSGGNDGEDQNGDSKAA